MDKNATLEKLAIHYGLIPDRTTTREHQEFLNAIGINTESLKSLTKELEKIENLAWTSFFSPLQVVKYGEIPVISLSLPEDERDKSFEWVIQEEGGRHHHGEFYAPLHKAELSLPIRLNIGYHNLKIRSETGKESSMKLIIVPRQCYKPLALEKHEKVSGFKFSLYKGNSCSNYRVSSYRDLQNAINFVKSENAGILGVDSINQCGRMAFSTLLIDVDEAINFTEDRDIRLKILTEEFQESIKRIQESEILDLKSVFIHKLKIYKIIYHSFRENHINKNTPKSQDFFRFLSAKGDNLRKQALFEAIKEHLLWENPKLTSWHEWPESFKDSNSEAVMLFEKNNIETIHFYEFLQWQADIQLNIAGRTSWINKLAVGICAEWDFCINRDESEAWLKQDYYAYNAVMEYDPSSAPIIPSMLQNNGYKYISEMIVPDMIHTGAVKLKGIRNFDKVKWLIRENPDIELNVQYPYEDILGVIALESHRNKCVVVVDETDELLEKYGFLTEEVFDIKEINVEEIPQLSTKGTEYNRRIEIERIPLSAYRLQFNKYFTFKDAQNIIPYLKELGVSHCYASPILRARSGSMHGYDIINHAELNPEIGSIQEFYDFVNTLHYYDMGLVVDIVPNHMGIGNENKWWMDVLENGQASRYASYFDIDWEPLKKELKGKILVPVLGDHYGNTLSSGQFKFHFNHETGKLTINYWEHEFPINPSSYPMFLEHRIEVLESRMGSNNTDFLEYLSIITAFKKLPEIREKNIASRRLAELCSRNQLISGFIQENLVDFRCEGNDSISCNRIHNLLEEQAYRLAYWRVSIDVVNYRRFFDVNHLIGLKTENPLVFTSTHSLILDLIEQEKIDGLRLDHPDGLLDPTNYFKTLQSEAGKRLGINFDSTEANLLGSEKLPIYVIAEKILAPFEKIPRNWAINGTVGYEFLNQLCNLMIDARNAKKFKRVYQRFIESVPNFGELVVDCKKIIMKTSLTSELSTLSNHLNRISERYYSTRDYTLNNLREALTEIIACFPVYRTYISQEQKGDKAIQFIKWAIGLAKKRTLYTDPSIFDFIEKVLLVELEDDKDSEEYRDTLKFAMEFQQYTAPLMAKGLEDTSFYRYNKLIALNEVGGEPVHFGISIKDFHNHNIRRLERTPHGMICTSTHDTKRSEDVRARLCVLSEIPDKWQEKITRWSTINQSRKLELDKVLAPDKNDEYLFYQTLLGIWPCETPNEAEKEVLITRLEDYMLKAIREAKAHTSWVNINTPYEDAIKGYIRKVLTSPENHPFWKEFLPFHKDVAHVGFLNSLFQCALKLTCPGVPDIYQGSELYKFTLVDPDNRKPVDYNYLRQKLNEVKANDLYPLESGKMKMFLTSSILNFRQKHQDIFRKGNYIPLETKGSKARNLVVFSRQFDNKAVIVVVPRLSYNMVSEATPLPAGEEVWKDTSIIIPAEYFGRKCVNIFTNQEFVFTEERINAGKILNTLPFAMLFI